MTPAADEGSFDAPPPRSTDPWSAGERGAARPQGWLSAIWARLEHMFGADLRSLALFRIAIAAVGLGELAARSVHLRAHYTDEGVMPRAFLLKRGIGGGWSLHMMSGSWQGQAILMILAGLCLTGLLVGYRTRLCTALSWLLMISVHARNPMLLQGGDDLLRCLMFWAMFLPLGARWSVDAARSPEAAPPAPRIVSMGTIGLFLQIAFVYWFTAILKNGPEWRTDGTAIYYALSIDQFATPLGKYLLHFPRLLEVMTRSVLWFEVLGPCLLFLPVRTGAGRMIGVLGFVALQVGFGTCLALGQFPFIASTCMLAFLPSSLWDSLEKRLEHGTAARLLAYCEGVARRAAGRLTGPHRPRPPSPRMSLFGNLLAGGFLAYVLLWNLTTIRGSGYRVPRSLLWIGPTLHINQSWNMFAPAPLKDDGWYVIPATLRDGRQIDLFKTMERWDTKPEVSWEKPENIALTYRSERWRKYLMNLWGVHNEAYRLPFARWVCREWNARHQGAEQVVKLEIVFMMEWTRPLDERDEPSEPQKTVLWTHTCF